jgi:FAD/FMN-containing dehydrogenase
MSVNDNDSNTRPKRRRTGEVSRRVVLASAVSLGGTAVATALPALVPDKKARHTARPKETNAQIDVEMLRKQLKGRTLTQSDADFNSALMDGFFNRLLPTDRKPQILVQVQDEDDVCRAVTFAKENKLKVVVRGGGHNWCNPALRRGGLMIDLHNLNKVISVDPASRKAVLQPIISNRDVQRLLNPLGLAYPSGHCPQVKLSGYLLSGGMSWNQGVWGPGTASVEAIEIVTPDGKLITASDTENQDYFWAARGAGPGFFGVAVRYHLKLYPLPKHIAGSSYYYNLDDAVTLAEWLGKIAPQLPPQVELSLWLVNAPAEIAAKAKLPGGKAALVTATTFADSEEEARKATAPLDQCPIIEKCLSKTVNERVNFEQLFDISGSLWPVDRRNAVEAMFSNSKPADLFRAVAGHYRNAPSHEGLIMYAFFTGPETANANLTNAAFSTHAHLYGGPWTLWKDAADDEANLRWHRKCVEILRPFTFRHYVGESDTVSYPSHVKHAYSEETLKRIEQLRKKYDPTGVFFNYSDGLS